VLIGLVLVLPVRLPQTSEGSSTEECLLLADRPPSDVSAIPRFEQCATAVPEDLELLADLGSLYESAGRKPDAEAVYRRILSVDNDYADVHVRLARLLLPANRDAARHHLERALALQPNRRAILDMMAALGAKNQ